jgi:hypothetical protein
MAITIEWGTKIISVEKSDMVLIQSSPTEVRQLNLDTFRLKLKLLEETSDGMAFERTHQHNTSVSLSGVIYARVIEILNGYTVTFEDGQYAVNLVGANSNVADVVNVNQVSVRTNNSAGLQDLTTLLSAAYNGAVTVSLTAGQSGTDIPIGTRATPVNNLTDGIAIANANGIHRFDLVDSCIFNSLVDASTGYIFHGDNVTNILIEVEAGANVSNCEFHNTDLSGYLDPNIILRGCQLGNIYGLEGRIYDSAIQGTITLNPYPAFVDLINCYGHHTVIGQMAIIDLGGSGTLVCRDFNGGLKLKNKTSSQGEVSLDINSGYIVVDSSCTAGVINIRGTAKVIDNSGPGCTVNADVNADVEALLTTQMTESYAPAGTAPTMAEALFLIQQFLTEFNFVGTTKTVKKLDGITDAVTLSLDSNTSPTALSRDT